MSFRKITCAAVVATAFGAIAIYAADQAAELKKLRQERASLASEMVTTRARLIEQNDDLKSLHQQIIGMHRELAIKLDSIDEMKKLNLKAEELDRKIIALQADIEDAQ